MVRPLLDEQPHREDRSAENAAREHKEDAVRLEAGIANLTSEAAQREHEQQQRRGTADRAANPKDDGLRWERRPSETRHGGENAQLSETDQEREAGHQAKASCQGVPLPGAPTEAGDQQERGGDAPAGPKAQAQRINRGGPLLEKPLVHHRLLHQEPHDFQGEQEKHGASL
ncbi:MAG: hypothetical protein U0793_10025 [Gemmataceae bacterium]